MSIKWDKEKIALSVAGSLVTIVLGYLVWRHEQTVSAANAAQQQTADAANAAELQQEISALPTYTQGGGASGQSGDNGSSAGIDAAPTDSNIAAILAAFFGGGTTGGGSGSTTGTGVPTSGSGTSNPVLGTTGGGGPEGNPHGTGVPVQNPPSTTPGLQTFGTGGVEGNPVARPNPHPIITFPTPINHDPFNHGTLTGS